MLPLQPTEIKPSQNFPIPFPFTELFSANKNPNPPCYFTHHSSVKKSSRDSSSSTHFFFFTLSTFRSKP
ncbi:hypothetical protein M6B38_297460 [Iris pallida]|uniref:Uncharacterized protein n=1 Tax=Iris pallida TaxID=29817 RepID=A0AAX6HS16_IRIPA|nr:hypothetical protein M6B38_297460 [Iris pallida]